MKTKIVGIIVIVAMLAGFISVVGQMANQASAAVVIEFDAKGSKDQGSVHGEYQDGSGCKIVITPSDQINQNSKC